MLLRPREILLTRDALERLRASLDAVEKLPILRRKKPDDLVEAGHRRHATPTG